MLEGRIFSGISTTFMKDLTYTYAPIAEDLSYLLTTPQIVEVIIEASSKMLDPLLPSGYITVGRYLEITHEQPTLIMEGAQITIQLVVDHVEGNRVSLDVKGYDRIGLICQGRYERAVVNKTKLLDATHRRANRFLTDDLTK